MHVEPQPQLVNCPRSMGQFLVLGCQGLTVTSRPFQHHMGGAKDSKSSKFLCLKMLVEQRGDMTAIGHAPASFYSQAMMVGQVIVRKFASSINVSAGSGLQLLLCANGSLGYNRN